MKALAVPFGSSAIAAALSLIFYGAFSHFYGDILLGWVIMLVAAMSLVQLGLVPQAWLYVIGAPDDVELRRRFSISTVVEAGGGALGFCVLLAIFSLPIELLRNHRAEALLVFGGLWVAGSSSVRGLLRASNRWGAFAAWVLVPNVLRVMLVLALPVAANAGLMPDLASHPILLICAYFFIPDLTRYLLVNLPFLLRFFTLPSIQDVVGGLRIILRNWLYDIGSAITESGDKLVVGVIVGPHLLATYFFARRIGAAVAIVIEPFYAEYYRRIALAPVEQRMRRKMTTYFQGLSLGLLVYILSTSVILVACFVPQVATYVPQAVQANLLVFNALLLVDAGVAANRWSRYLAQSGNRSFTLLVFRIGVFITFCVSLLLLEHLGDGLALSLSFLLIWILDALFVSYLLRSPPPFASR